MKAVVTVIGKDRVGIMSSVCNLLTKYNINILDVSQTVMEDFFTMVMLVDISACSVRVADLSDAMAKAGEEQNLSIRIQREDIFQAMHRI